MPAPRRMTRRGLGRTLGAGLGALGLGFFRLNVASRADDAPGKSDPAKADGSAARFEEFRRAAGRYRMVLETDPPRTLSLVAEPVLRWTNPLRKTNDGAVFVWVSDGRPEVVASLYRYTRDGETIEEHEFQSLAPTGLTVRRDGAVVWSPQVAGVALVPVPGAPVPAETPAARLRQLRAMSREFHAGFDLDDNRSELRLLTQPLHRYESVGPDPVLDGALFAFVQTTDPEVLLLLESRRPRPGAAPAWHFAFARMSMVNLRGGHHGKDLWRVPWEAQPGPADKPYLTLPAPPVP